MATANMFHRSRSAKIKRERLFGGFLSPHVMTIEKELRKLGADDYNLLQPESHVLPLIIRPEEQIIGIVYGRYNLAKSHQVGRGALVATDKRVLLIDKKPLCFSYHEMPYLGIDAVAISQSGPAATVSLKTIIGDVYVRTLNLDSAATFVSAIDELLEG